ncbi:DUF554 family protein, partial [Klebsiella grimontii]|uniref:DUF554 family protein n=1 Tax=Klebsiella grimontii TaxID=2058152 RepID=UPI00391BB14C
GGKNSLNRLIRCVCGKKIGPDPRNFNQRVSLGRNDLLIRTFPKSILDFFTAAIFASALGYIIAVIFVPQLIVFAILFFAASFIMVFITPSMIADFTACGGIVMLATGFRLCGIRAFPTANMLPSLLLVMPFSAAWQQCIA